MGSNKYFFFTCNRRSNFKYTLGTKKLQALFPVVLQEIQNLTDRLKEPIFHGRTHNYLLCFLNTCSIKCSIRLALSQYQIQFFQISGAFKDLQLLPDCGFKQNPLEKELVTNMCSLQCRIAAVYYLKSKTHQFVLVEKVYFIERRLQVEVEEP